MEKAYWLGRKQAALKMAENAASSEARLAHYDLAGRYSLNAVAAETPAIEPGSRVDDPATPLEIPCVSVQARPSPPRGRS